MFIDCGLPNQVLQYVKDMEGDQAYFYGDKAFYLEPGMIGACRAARNPPITIEEWVFNSYTVKRRMSVEWGFGKITRYFQFPSLLNIFETRSLPYLIIFLCSRSANKLSYLLLLCKNCYVL